MKTKSVVQKSKSDNAASPVEREVEARVVLREGVTVEALAYLGVVLVAALLRMSNLGAAALSPHEATQALAAYQGTALTAGGSPLLYTLNQILFGLTGSSFGDAGARLGAALIGTLLVLVPLLYRKVMGQLGVLAAAVALAISPTLAFASRQIDGQAIAAAGALLAMGLGLRYAETKSPRALIGLALTIGVTLTSGPGVVTLAIVIGLGLLMVYRVSLSDEQRAVWRSIWQERASLQQIGVWAGLALVAIATVLLTNLRHLGAVPELFSAWLAAGRAPDTIGALQILQSLLIYEPLIVWVGLAGLLLTLRRHQPLSIVLSVWAIGALLMTLIQSGRQTTDLTLMLVPLAMLAGRAVQHLADALGRHGNWLFEGILWLVATPLTGYLAVTLSSYAMGHNLVCNAQILGQTMSPLVSFVVLLLILAMIVGAVFSLAISLGAVLRAGAAAVIAVFIVIAFGNAWSITHLRAGDRRELLWGPTAVTDDVHQLVTAVQAASNRATGFRQQAAIDVALPQFDPVVAWYLRDFKNVQFTAAPDAVTPIVITPLGVEPPSEPGGYIGARFTTQTAWSPSALTDETLLRWWLYREGDVAAAQTLVVWVKPGQ